MSGIQEKIDKANEVIEKKQNLIAKRYAGIKKKFDQLNKLGLYGFQYQEDCEFLKKQCWASEQARRAHFDIVGWDNICSEESDPWRDLYYEVCTVEEYIESIENAYKAIEEKKAVIEKYKAQQSKADEKELEFDALPDVIKQFAADVVDMWDEWDLYRQASVKESRKQTDALYEDMYKARRELGYEGSKEQVDEIQAVIDEVRSQYSQKEWNELPYMTEEAIHEENVKNSKVLALDLAYRVERIVEDIVDASDLRLSRGNSGCVVINGIVKGKSKVAKVQSVGAGGYNIQRFHIRTLVNEVRVEN